MRWEEISELLLKALRLYHDPVAVFFLREGEEFRPEARPKNRLSICQYLAHVREVGESLLLLPENLHCHTAAFVVGFPYREERVMKSLHKFLRAETAERLYKERPRLKEGEFKGVGFSPLAKAHRDPEVVLLVVDSLQAAHLLNFYLYGAEVTEIPFSHSPNAAVCGTMVKAYLSGVPAMSFPCPGAFSSGKIERGEVILAFPGEAFKVVVKVLEEKARKGKVSFLGGPRLVGEDVCRNCPLISFGPPEK